MTPLLAIFVDILMPMQDRFRLLNEYYDKIFVLSLPRLTNRINFVKKTLKGLNFEFFYGIDKEHVSINELKEKGLYTTEQYQQFYKKPKEISLGMLCCSLGHLRIYETIAEKGYEKTLVLEDDALPILESLDFFSRIIQELPEEWEILYLGCEKRENAGLREKVKQVLYMAFPFHSQLKLTRQIFSNYYPVGISEHIAKAGFHDCTHAYAITQQAAQKLIKEQKPVRFHPDNLLSYMASTGQLKAYVARPKLFNQLTAFVNGQDSLTSD
ncbi:MAG TPA: glycosyltransferase family 25 protein [Chitinophagaceae bacterium]